MYDVIIVGSGPAGLTATVYCVQKRLETLVIGDDWGGKANYRMALPGLEGHEVIRGLEIVERFKTQIQYLGFAQQSGWVTKAIAQSPASRAPGSPDGDYFTVCTHEGKEFEGRALIIATGAHPRMLGLPDETRLMGRGLSYSAISHAPLFFENEVAVVGSGPPALRGAAELSLVARHVVLLAPDHGSLDSPLGRMLIQAPNVELVEGSTVTGIGGQTRVESVSYLDADRRACRAPVAGLFIELGLMPNTGPFKGLVELDSEGRVLINTANETSRPGVFAAGDATSGFAEQVLISVGEGAKAALSCYDYLLKRRALADVSAATRGEPVLATAGAA